MVIAFRLVIDAAAESSVDVEWFAADGGRKARAPDARERMKTSFIVGLSSVSVEQSVIGTKWER